jgi:hypothetical protein
MSRIVYMHGMAKKIVSDWCTQFTSKFWVKLHESMDIKMNFSSAYYTQTLEDMLRACALKYEKSWDKRLSYVGFSYNNSYQATIEMAPFEPLYGR